MKILIKNGLLVDPANKREGEFDVLLSAGKVAKVSKNVKDRADEIINAKNKIISPGLIDMHVHARDLGQSAKETIKTASQAAALGGITTCLLMPNTVPPADSPGIIKLTVGKIKSDAVVNMYPAGGAGLALGSMTLAPLAQLEKAGAIAFTNDGKPFSSSSFLKKVLQQAKRLGLPVLSHCEDLDLSAGGAMNEGKISRRLNLPGIPAGSEFAQVAREILIAHGVGVPLHFMHMSAKESIELIRWGKDYGIKITCETAPHYFSVTDSAVLAFKANAKVNPPLKEKEDVEAVIKGLRDGTIDCIATDHAPHARSDKSGKFVRCANGLVGLETCLPLIFTKLVLAKKLKLKDALAKMTINPARILNLKNKGHLSAGADADIVIIDPHQTQVVDPDKFASKGRNTPFAGIKLRGWPVTTIVGGRVVMREGKLTQ